jgi:uncharacterized membrane protein HdeD (DUF308 family)
MRMSDAAAVQYGGSAAGTPGDGDAEAARIITSLWWVSLLLGIAWIIAAVVILQFDSASITTIGVIVGIMFVVCGLQQFVLVAAGAPWRWLWAVFGVLFMIAGVLCFIEPESTFAGLADMLGFLFLLVGIWWTIRAFVERAVNPLWWIGLIGGILMLILAFWTAGQFFLEKAYTLIVFAGIWALMQGFTDIIRAFALRRLRDDI